MSQYFSSVADFVSSHGGKHTIEKVLVANNGIAAVKVIRSVRRWAFDVFGNERAIAFVAMATPEDLRANAEYIRMADEFVEVPGGSNVNNYANVSLIVELAKRYRVDAVFAGWGHASENPALPNTLATEGIVFMGPPGGPMFALGDKIGSTIIAQSAGVPVIPWSGDGLTCHYKASGGKIPDDVYAAANVSTVEQCKQACDRVGLPVMIKASEGGGGKGIRKVMTADQIEQSFRQVQSEVPGSPIFVMKVAFGARHLEVQLLADTYGNAVALNGRDCSVQRRHQKILEEGPPTSAPKNVWRQMERAAVRLAQEVGYSNAGTVEYLFREEDSTFYFLELNPRLQVEHPVTEMITGVNLPAAQLQVAMGLPLWRIADVRRYFGHDPQGVDPIDFDAAEAIPPDGHCIAARITAENPHKGFQPTSGKIQELNFRSSRHVWGYFSIDSSGLVHEFADSQLGHVFAWGPTREVARRNLVVALKDMSIRGDIRTTVEYLKDLLDQEDYKNNRFHTAWLDERIALKDVKGTSDLDAGTKVLVGAACDSHARALKRERDYISALERGQLPSAALLQQANTLELILDGVKYKIHCVRAGPSLYALTCNGSTVAVEVRSLADGGFLCLLGGKSHVAYLKDEVGARRLVVDSQTCLFVDEYDPTSIRAAMGGKVVRFLVNTGDLIKKDQVFCEVEVMKMVMPLLAPEDGTITLLKTAGAVLEPGHLIARLDLVDPSKVRKAVAFTGSLPVVGQPWPEANESMPHHVLKTARERLEHVMTGFLPPRDVRLAALKALESVLLDPNVPVLELREVLARVRRNLDYTTNEELDRACAEAESALAAILMQGSAPPPIPVSMSGTNLAAMGEPAANDAKPGVAAMSDEQHKRALQVARRFAEQALAIVAQCPDQSKVAPLVQVLNAHAKGAHAFALGVLEHLLELYAEPEAAFAELDLSDSAEKDDVMQELRRKFASEPRKVYDICLSHAGVATKNELAVALLSMVESSVRRQEELGGSDPSIRPGAVALLKRISGLRGKETTEVTLEARQLLIELQHPSYRDRLDGMVVRLDKIAHGDATAKDELVHSTEPILHMLIDVIVSNEDSAQVRAAALESYVGRVYQTYSVRGLKVQSLADTKGTLAASWSFYSEPDSVTFGIGPPAVQHEPLGSTTSTSSAPGIGPGALVRGPSASGLVPTLTRAGSTPEGSEAPPSRSHNRSPSVSSQGGNSVGNNPNRPRAGSETANDDDYVDAGELMAHAVAPYVVRRGALACFDGLPELDASFDALLQVVKGAAEAGGNENPRLVAKADVQVLHIVLRNMDETDLDVVASSLTHFLKAHTDQLRAGGVRRVTFAVPPPGKRHGTIVAGHGSSFFTFRQRREWQEDRLVRHIEPSLAFQLDLKRLSNFNIARVPLGKRDVSASRTVHVYKATPKHGKGGSRLFVRALVRQTSKVDGVAQADAYPGPERVLVQAIAAIEAVQGYGGPAQEGARNHIFLNVLGDALVEPHVVERMAKHLGRRYASRLAVARVGQVELKVNARLDKDSPSIPVRVIASNPTGFGLRIDTYVEAADPMRPGHSVFYSISGGDDGGAAGALAAMGLMSPSSQSSHESAFNDLDDLEGQSGSALSPELHGLDASTPYPVSSPLEEKRSRALASTTAYCYDLPAIFHKALERSWIAHAAGRRGVDIPSPSTLAVFEELVLDDEIDAMGLKPIGNGLATTTRPPGINSIAMIAWRAKIKTPQYPAGREMVLIANDITLDAGSFGTREDALFLAASKEARRLGIPRLYIAANSGARIGMADEVKRVFKVAWTDPTDPSKGFDYLYLDPDAYMQLGPTGRKSVICDPPVVVNGETRLKITAIVGEGSDLGVENLRGSGLIAGETSRAYDETFTLTYVAGRSVGIGAYLVRLGQRTIQKGKDAAIILTGYQALNTLVGTPVYSSNLQLGGPGIMYANGVSHACVRNDLEGVAAMLQWLSYVPERRGSPLAITRLVREDPVDRDVAYVNDSSTPSDPRLLITGAQDANTGEWLGGLMDHGSFTEYMAGWAKTMITGRARLGGVPVGVIIPEARSVVTRVPADPAAPDSQERVVTQAGNVWYPDSSYKTASAIRDINREGLPLLFVINLRGFSGGQRDMYDSVLKYGSMIVDALVEFKQPVIVYIPPNGELRGGAWVVVDPTINDNVMEMWCDDSARGGVLEASGAASIKFRYQDQVTAMHRLDATLSDIDEKLRVAKEADRKDEAKSLADAIKQRETVLAPVYKQLATLFADCHDRPGRMVAKGVVQGVVPWSNARRFFALRLKRLLKEFEVAQRLVTDAGSMRAARALLREVFVENCVSSAGAWDTDAVAMDWLNSAEGTAAVEAKVRQLRAVSIAAQVEELGNKDPAAMLRGMMNLISRMSDEGRLAEREKLVSTLRRGVFILSSSSGAGAAST